MPSREFRYSVVADGLSKCFQLRSNRRGFGPFRPTAQANEIWALRNVSFDVMQGEAVGIVGRNGAGKSTLLEILAGIRPPTEGTATVEGRVAALLQLGAGFHPEFTGRENVYLAGSIQGFSRRQTEERFDEIAAFADVGVFLEQPVKTYSSGMYARLAFAVATAYEPDILIVDEILAVGDAPFQQKCVTRINRMRDNGLTLFFVSHSIDRMNALCDRALLLENGRCQFFGETAKATDLYLKQQRAETEQSSGPLVPSPSSDESHNVKRQTRGVDRYGSQEMRILSVEVCDELGHLCDQFSYGDVIVIRVEFMSETSAEDTNVSFFVRDETGVSLCGTMTWDEGAELRAMKAGDECLVTFRFQNRLRPGRFGICVALTQINRKERRKPVLYDQIDGVAGFASLWDPDRPIHYKFDADISVEVGSKAMHRPTT